MIRKVHFQNFRCLRDVELILEPLTVLVGPNSSGKTTVLMGLESKDGEVALDSDRWRQDPSLNSSIKWSYSQGGVLSLTTSRMKRLSSHAYTNADREYWTNSDFPPSPSHSTYSFAFDLAALRQENVLEVADMLLTAGNNLTNVFASLTRQQQGAVAKELCRLIPMFGDVDLQPTQQGRQRLRFQDRWKPGLWLAPEQVSDGTMLLLAFIVIQYQTRQADLITIEEPERALHPYLLDELVQMLRKMTTGEIGQKPVQIVLATHSAELLDYVRPEEVRFLTRSQEDGSVQVQQAPSGTTDWRRVYEEYNQSLGSIWLSGGMGGVPGA